MIGALVNAEPLCIMVNISAEDGMQMRGTMEATSLSTMFYRHICQTGEFGTALGAADFVEFYMCLIILCAHVVGDKRFLFDWALSGLLPFSGVF